MVIIGDLQINVLVLDLLSLICHKLFFFPDVVDRHCVVIAISDNLLFSMSLGIIAEHNRSRKLASLAIHSCRCQYVISFMLASIY